MSPDLLDGWDAYRAKDETIEYDWSNQPIEFLCGYVFTAGDLILGDFGDHVLIRCPVNQEDYRIYYHVSEGRKVLHTLARLEL